MSKVEALFMNTKTFKRLITSIEIILVGAIFLLFLGTCLNIEPIKGLNLTSYKYNGYKAFLDSVLNLEHQLVQ